jgi:puromycin-sensitive aminopeptidase
MAFYDIAHRWCGDAVSPKFWDSLWLNKGFATSLPTIAFVDIHPEWNPWELFVRRAFEFALLFDDSDFSTRREGRGD